MNNLPSSEVTEILHAIEWTRTSVRKELGESGVPGIRSESQDIVDMEIGLNLVYSECSEYEQYEVPIPNVSAKHALSNILTLYVAAEDPKEFIDDIRRIFELGLDRERRGQLVDTLINTAVHMAKGLKNPREIVMLSYAVRDILILLKSVDDPAGCEAAGNELLLTTIMHRMAETHETDGVGTDVMREILGIND